MKPLHPTHLQKVVFPNLDWTKGNGLIPAVIQDARTFQVLMVGMMSSESLKATLNDGLVTFYSRQRQRLWRKGETSGHYLTVVEALEDCDHDCLLFKVVPAGPTCHRQTTSCFGTGEPESRPLGFLDTLEEVLRERFHQDGNGQEGLGKTQYSQAHSMSHGQEEASEMGSPDPVRHPRPSYTASLFRAGIKRCAQKVGEEGVETALAAVAGDDAELVAEAADLVFHLMVTLTARQIPLQRVVDELTKRHKVSPEK